MPKVIIDIRGSFSCPICKREFDADEELGKPQGEGKLLFNHLQSDHTQYEVAECLLDVMVYQRMNDEKPFEFKRKKEKKKS